MIFTNDIVIRGECARIFRDLKDKFGFDYIDSFLYSSVLWVKAEKENIDMNKVGSDNSVEINIPRNVLISRQDKIDFISTMIVLIEKSKDNFEELLQLAYEENTIENPRIYRLTKLETYAIKGSVLLEEELMNHSYLEILDRVSDILSDIQH